MRKSQRGSGVLRRRPFCCFIHLSLFIYTILHLFYLPFALLRAFSGRLRYRDIFSNQFNNSEIIFNQNYSLLIIFIAATKTKVLRRPHFYTTVTLAHEVSSIHNFRFGMKLTLIIRFHCFGWLSKRKEFEINLIFWIVWYIVGIKSLPFDKSNK